MEGKRPVTKRDLLNAVLDVLESKAVNSTVDEEEGEFTIPMLAERIMAARPDLTRRRALGKAEYQVKKAKERGEVEFVRKAIINDHLCYVYRVVGDTGVGGAHASVE